MAEKKGIEIKKRVMAKLMILEYFRPESFSQLFGWQAIQEGKPVELKQLEAKKTSKNDDVEIWVNDEWLMTWINHEPNLSSTDLRPYFYFSRDTLSQKVNIPLSRMSIKAQEVLRSILSKSDSLEEKGIDQLIKLPLADISVVFQELTNRIGQEEGFKDRNKLIGSLIKIAGKSKEMETELIVFLGRVPIKLLSVANIPKLVSCFEGKTNESQMIKLFNKWAVDDNNNKPLSKAVQKHIDKKKN
jgi:hypothetical protein